MQRYSPDLVPPTAGLSRGWHRLPPTLAEGRAYLAGMSRARRPLGFDTALDEGKGGCQATIYAQIPAALS